jgi:predicted ester cyclase
MGTKTVVLTAWDELFNKRNPAADLYVHPDFVNHEAAAHRSPGPQGALETVAWLHDAFDDLRFDVEDAIAEGDRVALRVRMSGVHTGRFMTFAPTNRRFSVQHTHIVRVADGKIIEHWANRDDLGQMAQLGLLPPPPVNPR